MAEAAVHECLNAEYKIENSLAVPGSAAWRYTICFTYNSYVRNVTFTLTCLRLDKHSLCNIAHTRCDTHLKLHTDAPMHAVW